MVCVATLLSRTRLRFAKSPRGEAPYWLQWIWPPLDRAVLRLTAMLGVPAIFVDAYQDLTLRYCLPGDEILMPKHRGVLDRTLQRKLGARIGDQAESLRLLGETSNRKSDWGLIAMAAFAAPGLEVRLAAIEALVPITRRMDSASAQDEYRCGTLLALTALSKKRWLGAEASKAIDSLSPELLSDTDRRETLFSILAGQFGRTARAQRQALKTLSRSAKEADGRAALLFALFSGPLSVQIEAVEASVAIAIRWMENYKSRRFLQETRDTLESLRSRRPWLNYAINAALRRLDAQAPPGSGDEFYRRTTARAA